MPHKQPCKFTALDLVSKTDKVYLVIGDERGNVKLHELRPGTARFLFQVSLHQQAVFQLKEYSSEAHGISGFLTGSTDGSIVLMQVK